MDWVQLLNTERLKGVGDVSGPETKGERGEFERDYSRVLYSTPFRRLHNKTQVFPMPINDHVHSRLTHSIEVADFGMNLGNVVGEKLLDRHVELKTKHGYDKWDFGYIVSAACLAHDIGNPPFGHRGEISISSFFIERELRESTQIASPGKTEKDTQFF